jgi:mRNA interferase MazF
MPEQGALVLIPIPFTDLSSRKRRPVIVISNDAYNRSGEDVVVVAMTSRLGSGAFDFLITSSDMVESTLNHPGTVRADKIYTLAKSVVVKRFGKFSPQVIERIPNFARRAYQSRKMNCALSAS